MIAHIREKDGKQQSLKEHSEDTARLARERLLPCGLGTLAYLTGLLHDYGKATTRFSEYLCDIYEAFLRGEKYSKKTSPHSPAGAIFVYERYYYGDNARKKTAQIIAMAILGHHSGLCDCLDENSDLRSPFLEAMSMNKDEICYAEAERNFLCEVADLERLDELFEQATEELQAFLKNTPNGILAFSSAMTARLLLGALADADRWDTACFSEGIIPFEAAEKPKWDEWLFRLDERLGRFKPDSRISAVRAEISGECRKAGMKYGAGIYRLTVPTGGGKTLSALLFALTQAARKRKNAERLFYIAPYNSILDQNAKVIRETLCEEEQLLEHHGDIIIDDDSAAETGNEKARAYRIQTERWTSRIILTSMVQLLNTLFKGSNTNARRLPRLADSIIIFDEIQALPRKCTVLFECAIRYLSECLGCTVVLCTATQPALRAHSTDMVMTAENMDNAQELGTELISGVSDLFAKLRRVRFIDERNKPRTYAEAAEGVAEKLLSGNSVLMIVNTKKAALEIFAALKDCTAQNGVILINLTTYMCVSQRKKAIELMTSALAEKMQNPDAPSICCISTPIIEAGVDISFPVVIRSFAGIPSILQAAGRCNRNREAEYGIVFIWLLPEEKLSHLPEIRQAQQDSDAILDKAAEGGIEIDMPDTIDAYFRRMLHNDVNRPRELFYPIKTSARILYLASLLGKNSALSDGLLHREKNPLDSLSLRCSWRTVGNEFKVIDDDTVALIAPYDGGEEIIGELCGRCSYQRGKELLKKAQQYSVNVYRSALKELLDMRAVYRAGESGALAIAEEYYDAETGLVHHPQEMQLLIK
ncbi:MAG: CRISPR-associated helicase Cas3' [Eubacteriales bacterium]|nr:CRISPR-associated helicase Cas3' [Eubacteriales bacterium]MDD4513846.1 CRISPR-associated helicase Cas3' [Eubacteriales bacterium]